MVAAAIASALLLVAPGAGAVFNVQRPMVEADASVPCLVIDVVVAPPGGGSERVQGEYPPLCGPQRIEFAWNGSSLEGNGTLNLTLRVHRDDQPAPAGGLPCSADKVSAS